MSSDFDLYFKHKRNQTNYTIGLVLKIPQWISGALCRGLQLGNLSYRNVL